jgi:hypothetical protein
MFGNLFGASKLPITILAGMLIIDFFNFIPSLSGILPMAEVVVAVYLLVKGG